MQDAVPTSYPAANEIVAALLVAMRRVLGDKLVGCYLYGSLVAGDFDLDISDTDLLAVLAANLDDAEVAALRVMHQDFARAHPRWDDRIEVAYVPVAALRTYRAQTSMIAVISPGEPFHHRMAGIDWLANWYLVRETGVTLIGPPPSTSIEPIGTGEYLAAIYRYAQEWRERIQHATPRKAQAYAVLTLCRAARTLATGEQSSKIQAAEWAAREWPQWSGLIQQALTWRRTAGDASANGEATLPEVRRFVTFALGECERIYGGSATG